jgi:sec-independent protein translocase protein TatB
VFDLSLTKLLVLGAIALVLFGPDQLPKFAAQAGRALRQLRHMAEGAKADLREGLGPEFSDFDMADLHPRNFVRKHLLDDLDDNASATTGYMNDSASTATLAYGESPPYDAEAT